MVLAWSARAGLLGVSVDGTVYRSGDSGRTWQSTGSVGGLPEAIAVDTRAGGTIYVAVADGGIVVSDDGGRNFSVRYAE